VSTQSQSPDANDRLILVGNPNVGKSVIFSHLTGQYVIVSNYPGTTVEISKGKARGIGENPEVIDTPGILSLNASSEDEVVTRNLIWDSKNPLIIQVADAKNLRRNLLITIPLLEMGIPMHLDLNMIDEAKSRGVHIDSGKLEKQLGIGVTETIATRRKGIERLKKALPNSRRGSLKVNYSAELEQAVERISELLPQNGFSPRAQALMILSEDNSTSQHLYDSLGADDKSKIAEYVETCRKKLGGEPADHINQHRLGVIERILKSVMITEASQGGSFRAWLGRMSMHPVWGVPILAAVLFLIYEFVGVFGAGTCVDFLESVVFEGYVNPFMTSIFEYIQWPFLQDLMVGDYGVITMAITYSVAIVFPVVGAFFLVFGFLEDSGYLPRLAFMVDRFFRIMGLNGKAVLPMILGLGCDTMATLTSRILETKKERVLVTLLLALGIPCSAQLGVILGMLSGISPWATFIWVGTVIGIIFLVGLLYSTLFPGRRSDFILEVPPLRWPQISNILVKTLARIEWYLKEAVPLFVLGTLVLFFLNYFDLLTRLETMVAPIVSGMVGLPKEVTGPFLIGFLRRDYGAAGLFVLARDGLLDPIQIVVSLVTITLFMPCVANLFIIIKERGLKTAIAMSAFIFPFAFLVGAALNWVLRTIGVSL
jgi:ferrous iron transport protein B